MNLPESVLAAIFTLCKAHRVKSLYAFGSVVTGEWGSESDVDLIVDFAKMPVEQYADNYFDLKFALQDVLKRPVDLLEEQAVRNPWFKETLDREKQLVYGN